MRMGKRFTSCVTAALLLFCSAAASATPSERNNCRAVVNPPSGNSFMHDDACNTVYVMPPTTGEARATAAAPTTNIQFCPQVLQTHTVTERTIQSARIISDKIVNMMADFSPLEGEIETLASQLSAAAAEKNRTATELDDARTRKQELTDELTAAKSAYDLCALLNTPALCSAELAELNDAKNALRDFLTAEFLPKQSAANAAKAQYDRLADEYARKTTRLAEAFAPLFDLQARLFEVLEQIMGIYDRYTAMEGARVQLTYSIPWERMIQDYQNANPGRVFRSLPIVDGQLHATVSINDQDTTVPAVLDFSIPGVRPQGPRHLPVAVGAIKLLSAPISAPATDNAVSVAFGGSVSAGLLTSLLGSCPFYPQGLSGPPQHLNQFAAFVPTNASYTYEVVAHRGYTARYNMSQWLTRLERKVKRGGFFSSSTLHEIYEDANSSDWFSIEFDQDKVKFPYTAAEKQNITREVKGQLMERALRLLAIQNGMLPGPAGGAGSLPPTGAGVAAGYLLGGCGFWSWCTVGGWILGVLDSIFGRSEAVSNFRRNNNVWVTDRVVDTTVLLQTGHLSFVPPAS